jgi:hypothetical protein
MRAEVTPMAQVAWQVAGDYFETCSCTFLCPCISSNMASRPSHGDCYFALAFHIDRGRYGTVTLDGLSFAVIGYTPAAMGEGHWSVGVVVDERASQEQRDALAGIGSGQAGGPMAAVGPLVERVLGVEARPITYKKDGMKRSLSIPGVLDQSLEGVPSPVKAGEPLYVDNTLHPANARLALARASSSRLSAFGLRWEDMSGQNNGHFAPFSWKSA